jgi:hypothetical protein
VKNLYMETKALWTEKHATLAARWARALEGGVPKLELASEKFREWKPLRFYVSVSDVSPTLRFSLRYRGQEVATVSGASLRVDVTAAHAKNNRKFFQVDTPAGKTPWSDARAFRALFRTPAPRATVKSPEHELEARILSQLEVRRGADKFGGTLRGVRHAGITRHEYPLQFPLPLSASKGHPTDSRGNVDVLVRRGSGRGTHLGVWELKAPGEFQHALAQAYVYAVTLALVLRSRSGPAWYRLFGFGGGVPRDLALEAAVVVSPDQEPKVARALREFAGSPLRLEEERATISLAAYYYTDDDGVLKLRREPLAFAG